MTLKLVDLSSNNPNWQSQIKGTDGAIIKATQGTGYVNPLCNAQFTGVNKAGGVLGLYHYAGGGDPKKEAQYFISNIKNYVGEATLWLDWEQNQNSAWGNKNWGQSFATEVHRLTGVWPGVYVQASAIAQVASMASSSALWLAGYPTEEASWTVPSFIYSTGAWKDLTIWQFTSGGGLDRNIAYLDKASWAKLAKGSGTVKVTAAPAKKASASKLSAAKAGSTANKATKSSITKGTKVKVNLGATKWATGQTIPSYVKGSTYTVQQVSGTKVLLAGILSWISKSNVEILQTAKQASSSTTSTSSTFDYAQSGTFRPSVKVNVRTSASTSGRITGSLLGYTIHYNHVYVRGGYVWARYTSYSGTRYVAMGVYGGRSYGTRHSY